MMTRNTIIGIVGLVIAALTLVISAIPVLEEKESISFEIREVKNVGIIEYGDTSYCNPCFSQRREIWLTNTSSKSIVLTDIIALQNQPNIGMAPTYSIFEKSKHAVNFPYKLREGESLVGEIIIPQPLKNEYLKQEFKNTEYNILDLYNKISPSDYMDEFSIFSKTTIHSIKLLGFDVYCGGYELGIYVETANGNEFRKEFSQCTSKNYYEAIKEMLNELKS